MGMMLGLRLDRPVAALLLSMATACPADDGGTTGGGTMGTATGTEATGPIDDAEAFCAQFTEPSDCTFIDDAQGVYCSWTEVTPVTVEAGACMLGEPVGSCEAQTGNTTAAGCGPPPGCDGEPFYLDHGGEIRVFLQCGGSGPLDAQPCTYIEPGVFEPPECGCLCDVPLGGSSSGGSSGG